MKKEEEKEEKVLKSFLEYQQTILVVNKKIKMWVEIILLSMNTMNYVQYYAYSYESYKYPEL